MASEQPSQEPARSASRARALIALWLLAAAFAACALAFAARYYAAHFEAEQLSEQLALADVALKSARVQLEAEQLVGARLASDYAKSGGTADAKSTGSPLKLALLTGLPAEAPNAIGAAVWDPRRGEGVFTVEKLPPNKADQEYELWLIDSKPVSVDVFTIGPDGRAKISFRRTGPVQDVTKFAVSCENNDGRRSHTTPAKVVMRSE